MTGTDQVVLAGEWLYDGAVPMPVFVVRYDFDYLFEMAKDDAFHAYGDEVHLEPGEEAELNEEGSRYDLVFQPLPSTRSWPDARGGVSVEEAKAAAERLLPSPVVWSDP